MRACYRKTGCSKVKVNHVNNGIKGKIEDLGSLLQRVCFKLIFLALLDPDVVGCNKQENGSCFQVLGSAVKYDCKFSVKYETC